jgi:hypothetical protein
MSIKEKSTGENYMEESYIILWRICPMQELLSRKPRNARNNRITSVYSSLLGDGQRANEITVGVT